MPLIHKFNLSFILLAAFIFGQDDAEILSAGKNIYLQSCAVCHGISGKGDGVVAGNLEVKPRNFTDGKFKVRSTRSGQVPLDEDLYKILSRGMGHDNAMLPWSHLPVVDKHLSLIHI